MGNDKIKPAAVAVDSLLSALDKLEESGQVLSWVRDWVLTDPQNAGTGAKYHGFNTLRCSLHNAIGGYAENLFITASGARSAGGSINADEWKNYIVLVRPNIRKLEEDGVEVEKCIGWIYFKAWNIEQSENVDRSKLKVDTAVAAGARRKKNADATIRKSGANIKFGGSVAAYSPTLDNIVCPSPESFQSTEGYYSTLFHELVHWTGGKDRLNRFTADSFATSEYAKEELVAEFGAFALCAVHGIKADEHNALAYIQGWKRRIKDEQAGAVVTSVSNSQKAVRLILGIK